MLYYMQVNEIKIKEIKMPKVWLSLDTDEVFATEAQAQKSGDDYIEGRYCTKCGCTTTTECNCKYEKEKSKLLNKARDVLAKLTYEYKELDFGDTINEIDDILDKKEIKT